MRPSSDLGGGLPLQLIDLKIAGMLFPTSDFWHPVVTPALLCLSQLLTKVRRAGPPRTKRDSPAGACEHGGRPYPSQSPSSQGNRA